jgi:hypothetical protein
MQLNQDTGKIHVPVSAEPFLDGPYYTNRAAKRAYQRSIRKHGAGFTRPYRKGRKEHEV